MCATTKQNIFTLPAWLPGSKDPGIRQSWNSHDSKNSKASWEWRNSLSVHSRQTISPKAGFCHSMVFSLSCATSNILGTLWCVHMLFSKLVIILLGQ